MLIHTYVVLKQQTTPHFNSLVPVAPTNIYIYTGSFTILEREPSQSTAGRYLLRVGGGGGTVQLIFVNEDLWLIPFAMIAITDGDDDDNNYVLYVLSSGGAAVSVSGGPGSL